MRTRTGSGGGDVVPGHEAPAPVGRSSVHSIRTTVDFPAPFGPEEAVDLPRAHREVEAVDGGQRRRSAAPAPA